MKKLKLVNDIEIGWSEDYRAVARSIEKFFVRNGYCIVHYLYWANFAKSRRNIKYNEALKAADFILPDGVGLLSYIRLLYGYTLPNLNGTDLNPYLIEYFSSKKYQIAFWGTTESSISKCYEKYKSKLGDLLYYYQNGFLELKKEKIKPRSVLFVGLGTPKQEIWCYEHFNWIKEKSLLVITVGGFFDFCSGVYKRAPKIIRSVGMEWFFRFVLHPHKHWKKYINNFYFPFYLFMDSFRKKSTIRN